MDTEGGVTDRAAARLSAMEIAQLRASFSSITHGSHGPSHLAQLFYAALFSEHPQYRALFPISLEEPARKFTRALEFVVDNLEEPGPMTELLAQLGRDHRKYGITAGHYEAAGSALIAAVRSALSHVLWTPTLDSAWSGLVSLLLTTMRDAADADDLPAAWTATVVGHERRLDDLAIVRLESDQPIPFHAGQYLSVQIPQRPRQWRYLSVAIPPNPYGQIEFHVRRVSGGWVSPAIVNETRVGDRWQLASPLGGLEVDRDNGLDVLMIGSGSGIAPLRAQVMEMAQHGNNPRVHMFVGGRYPRDLYDIEALWELSLSNPWLTVVPVSEEDENPWWHTTPDPEPPPGMHRRLHGRLGRVVAEFGSWADRQVQISGSPSMIKTTVYSLRHGGTPPELIQHDPLV
ncbi:NAD(P)H-flavin reductase [Rhodococcus triatomae]|uniref:nitric oxide dioxygenase n=2 Tax=Rhodococcus triatomae TaxID=300028 RepID=A0A1G8PKD9_9NOCA|nr:NAD(P)H-flavin reductase [Rhodococcus triatomae]